MSAAVCAFPTLRDAVDCVLAVSQNAIPVARIELLDEMLIDAINRHNGLDHTVAPTLFLEFHGTPDEVAAQAKETEQIAAEHGGTGFVWATDEAQRRRMWDARHRAYDAARALRPGTSALTTDVCVPVSALADMHHQDAGRPRRARPDRLDRRPRRRRQLPRRPCSIDRDDPAEVRARHGVPRPRRARRARRSAARAPASTASATARRPTSSSSTAPAAVRTDARDQARARPRRPLQPRQDRRRDRPRRRLTAAAEPRRPRVSAGGPRCSLWGMPQRQRG